MTVWYLAVVVEQFVAWIRMEGQAGLSGTFGPTEPASLPTEFQALYKKKTLSSQKKTH